MNHQWFIYRDKKSHGPYTDQEVKRFAAEGIIDANTRLRKSTTDRWFKAIEFTTLESYFRPPDEDDANGDPASADGEPGAPLPQSGDLPASDSSLPNTKKADLPEDAIVASLIKDTGEIPAAAGFQKPINAPESIPKSESSAVDLPVSEAEPEDDFSDVGNRRTIEDPFPEAQRPPADSAPIKAVKLVNRAPVDAQPSAPVGPAPVSPAPIVHAPVGPGPLPVKATRPVQMRTGTNMFLLSLILMGFSVICCITLDVLVITTRTLHRSTEKIAQETLKNRQAQFKAGPDGRIYHVERENTDWTEVFGKFVLITHVLVHLSRTLSTLLLLAALIYTFNFVPHGGLKNSLAVAIMISVAALLIQIALKLAPVITRLGYPPFDYNSITGLMSIGYFASMSVGAMSKYTFIGLFVDTICIGQVAYLVVVLRQLSTYTSFAAGKGQAQFAFWSLVGHGALVLFIYFWPYIVLNILKRMLAEDGMTIESLEGRFEMLYHVTMYIDATVAGTFAIALFLVGRLILSLRTHIIRTEWR